jgi:hypothetical protein
MKKLFDSTVKSTILNRSDMYSFYFEDPQRPIERELNNTKLKYFYFNTELHLNTKPLEILNGSLLEGKASLIHDNNEFNLNQFDIFFLPPEQQLVIKPESGMKSKICIISSFSENEVKTDFEIHHFEFKKFIPRGEFGSREKMATYRTVWTAIKNGYYMSGFTNIPNESLRQGIVTSVNLDDNKIYPHIHSNFPEVYIYCIDDENYAITQYLVNSKGQSVCKDLSNGEGIFFPGNLGHINFSKPFYKDLKYCLYLWIIPTFGLKTNIDPITLKVS